MAAVVRSLLRATSRSTLIDYRYQRLSCAEHGKPGMGREKSGPKGQDMTLKVPVGTSIVDVDTDTVIADVTRAGERICIAEGEHLFGQYAI